MSLRELPAGFVESLAFAGDAASVLAEALASGTPPVSVRVNPGKGTEVPHGAERVAWCDTGFYLGQRPLFAADPMWHQGRYYVQEASSMAARRAMAHLATLHGGTALRVLDACAAPGGKTTAYAEVLPEGSLLVANEFDPARSNALLENTARHGAPAVVVTRAASQSFAALPGSFDIIAADMPCSGEGMMRKEPQALLQWSPALVRQCAALQAEIADALWSALRPGGYMLVSTCTFNRSENEDNIIRLIERYGAESVDLDITDYPGAMPSVDNRVSALRFLPGNVAGEGFFMAALRKPGNGTTETIARIRRNRTDQVPAAAEAFAAAHLDFPGHYRLIAGDTVHALAENHADFVDMLGGHVRILRPGVPLCTLKGRLAVPSSELLLNTAYRQHSLPQIDLDYSTACAYLRGEALPATPGMPSKGFLAVAYRGLPAGPAKSVGNRANNLYSPALRLRLTQAQLPPTAPAIIP